MSKSQIETKKCPRCKTMRLKSCFAVNKLGLTCKTCDVCKNYNLVYYKKNKEKITLHQKDLNQEKMNKKNNNTPYHNCTLETVHLYTSKNWVEIELVCNDFKCKLCNQHLIDEKKNLCYYIQRKNKNIPNLISNCYITCQKCNESLHS